ncbi:hypothetical protein WN944_007081 [Citrus x changshan-huyou]|uniref:Uncharacterized protein n=1 Tax=Citrus x changshan-huyou TaxID=2935761 RepID=A0AAP0MMV0_9ROSI
MDWIEFPFDIEEPLYYHDIEYVQGVVYCSLPCAMIGVFYVALKLWKIDAKSWLIYHKLGRFRRGRCILFTVEDEDYAREFRNTVHHFQLLYCEYRWIGGVSPSPFQAPSSTGLCVRRTLSRIRSPYLLGRPTQLPLTPIVTHQDQLLDQNTEQKEDEKLKQGFENWKSNVRIDRALESCFSSEFTASIWVKDFIRS